VRSRHKQGLGDAVPGTGRGQAQAGGWRCGCRTWERVAAQEEG